MPISSRASFHLRQESLRRGRQQVKRGQLLFALDDAGVRADLAQARADLAAEEERSAWRNQGRPIKWRSRRGFGKSQGPAGTIAPRQRILDQSGGPESRHTHELEANRLALAQAEADVQSLEKAKQTYVSQARLDMDASLFSWNTLGINPDSREMNSTHGTPSRMERCTHCDPPGDFVKEGDLLAEMATCTTCVFAHLLMSPNRQIDLNQTVEIFWDAHPDRV